MDKNIYNPISWAVVMSDPTYGDWVVTDVSGSFNTAETLAVQSANQLKCEYTLMPDTSKPQTRVVFGVIPYKDKKQFSISC